jgi:hypothetical protein
MKNLFAAGAVALAMAFSTAYAAEDAKPEVKKVCIDKLTKDGKPVLDKAGKPTQTCKEMKVHKKLEGTKVPEKK